MVGFFHPGIRAFSGIELAPNNATAPIAKPTSVPGRMPLRTVSQAPGVLDANSLSPEPRPTFGPSHTPTAHAGKSWSRLDPASSHAKAGSLETATAHGTPLSVPTRLVRRSHKKSALSFLRCAAVSFISDHLI